MNHPQTVRSQRLSTLAAIVALIMTLGPLRSAQALEALRPSLKELSQKIAKFLAGRGVNEIAVGGFTGPSGTSASAGPWFERILIEELETLKIQVKNRAGLEVKGDYRDVLDNNRQVLALRLMATVLDRSGAVILTADSLIDDRNILAQVLGINKTDFGDGRTPKQESEILLALLDKPSVAIHNARIQSDAKSKYAIEIHVKEQGRFIPREPSKEQGRAFVPIKRSDVFAVKLINDSDFDAAVELSVDGLSMFAFSDHPGYRFVVVPKRSSALIQGWHRTNAVSDEFLITDYSKSPAAHLLAKPDNIGTITATFAAAWEPTAKPPDDEGSKFRDPFNPAVGRGKPVPTPYEEVVRQHGRVRDVISVRYKKTSP
jgi:hypothetical protein